MLGLNLLIGNTKNWKADWKNLAILDLTKNAAGTELTTTATSGCLIFYSPVLLKLNEIKFTYPSEDIPTELSGCNIASKLTVYGRILSVRNCNK